MQIEELKKFIDKRIMECDANSLTANENMKLVYVGSMNALTEVKRFIIEQEVSTEAKKWV